MMKTYRISGAIGFVLLLLGLATVSAGPQANAPASAVARSVDTAAIDKLVEDALKAWQVPGAAIAIVRGDEVVYLKGYGVREVGGKEPVTPDTLFAIGSTSKAFTT